MKKFFILIFVFYVNLFSQIPEIKSEAPTKELGIKFDDLLKQAQTFQYPVLDPSLLALEKPIDPETYIVGPGDILSVNIWSAPPLNFTVQITTEGTAIIPTVGEVKVSGLTLSEAKRNIIQKIKSKYIASEITATLIVPRSFNVTVTGYVLNEGKYKVRSVDRVSTVLGLAFLPIDSFQLMRKATMIDSVNFRKILLKRNGKVINVDLRKYFATGDDKYNPYLLEGDWIVVQRRDLSSFVAIYGAVNKPGAYEFVQGDKLTDIVEIAGGTIESADLENVEIIRLDEEGKLKEKLNINLRKILNGETSDLTLENNDRIFIPEKRTLKQNYTVTIAGEVKYPGTYPISRNGTMLSEVISKAGLSVSSDLDNAYIIRGGVQFDPQREFIFSYFLLKNFSLSKEDSINFAQEVGLLDSVKFVSINIKEVINKNLDLELQDGDFIFVPRKQPSMVYVFGQVSNPGFVPYEAGKNYKYYILKAGGFSQLARKGDVKVIKRKTYLWYDAGSTEIEPGDFIFVPKKIVRESIYYWNLTKDIISTVGAVASTVATIILIYNQIKQK
ncbi:protein involved in polysaccharide export, contains SLBB domain of the beta-grasp fold [Candidatus Kryptonium thompsonii]|uniref:Protein involved in polysaccharide export, contains SLBB domain of the beta-grasp fold n=3 Tax=Candidatus Kryptonium thompsonii TaxID=1633631 RepID=A0A0P1LAB3_9BACT|nr:SLBB domain-containing protein [Candidatus Kryptonium thompsoni]CUS78009.1 protein involved in polysaccharide export, contains SLBB domain of the beta-grasp fold [Candidatus Kryptonium thompsoni]CUS79301.1 protein involved in polysaccharide export, contains SLBB domain of the beta-grasp fold [Candidatus Kryptonium thompsoni]CUS80914.1 protein involved in polysaccharide export, contains SLBB domain of the beta-grasp fold [Candidatus Kryptonium thompsoni]CUS95927.1 protein involved in polysacc